jgi:hypothetical protein
MAEATFQLINESKKGGEFSGKTTVTWLGDLQQAILTVTADAIIFDLQFNEMLAKPMSSTYQADVTKFVKQGENILRVKLQYEWYDILVGAIKTVTATLTVKSTIVAMGTPSILQDLGNALKGAWDTILGSGPWVVGIALVAVIVIVIFLIYSKTITLPAEVAELPAEVAGAGAK